MLSKSLTNRDKSFTEHGKPLAKHAKLLTKRCKSPMNRGSLLLRKSAWKGTFANGPRSSKD